MGISFPFTPFEELMLAQESAAYPCDIWVKMPLGGRLNRTAFEASVSKWLSLHPLLACKAVKGWNGHRWTNQPSLHCVEWQTVPNATEFAWPNPIPLSLTDGKGLAFTIVESEKTHGEDSSIVFLQFHHALADGLGIIQAIHELWILYDAEVNSTPNAIPPRSVDAMRNRNQFGLTRGKILRMLPRQLIGLAGVRQFLMRRPAPLIPHSPPTEFPTSVTTQTIAIPPKEMEQIKRVAREQKISVNEFLAAMLFVAVSQFRASRKCQSETDWLRMMVPMSMRTTADLKNLSACNVVSAIFLDRTPAQIRDRAQLRASVHDEMELIKNNKLAFLFLFSVWIRKCMAWGRHHSKVINRCETSFVFSNLGKVFHKSPLRTEDQTLSAGGIQIEDFLILAPLNPFMIGAFTFVQYGKQVELTLRYDDRVLKREDAVELVQLVQNTINGELETGGAA